MLQISWPSLSSTPEYTFLDLKDENQSPEGGENERKILIIILMTAIQTLV